MIENIRLKSDDNGAPDVQCQIMYTYLWEGTMGIDLSSNHPARFKPGDLVQVVGPGPRSRDEGEVVDVVRGFDYIHRYHVRFSDGSSARFFGFELQLRSTPDAALTEELPAEQPDRKKKAV
jgi:hypothetical protein